ncbi:hypothetical protein Enr13x_10520 [Stieleria neptunia]|uniref:Uncharacterized protein n=1 Tax=Stieleria neptunia TaxID=2527979 RepID=A0A518HK28_9BACT|nr:hypothetical protein Enr13x_10520 [Stieleria neptunia]
MKSPSLWEGRGGVYDDAGRVYVARNHSATIHQPSPRCARPSLAGRVTEVVSTPMPRGRVTNPPCDQRLWNRATSTREGDSLTRCIGRLWRASSPFGGERDLQIRGLSGASKFCCSCLNPPPDQVARENQCQIAEDQIGQDVDARCPPTTFAGQHRGLGRERGKRGQRAQESDPNGEH